ncbi:MAG: spermidine synthase [Opitutaceae bacterium]
MTHFARLLFFTGLAAIPLASFLTFLAQPLTGRALLPIYGGQAVVWLTVMLFFQVTLLAGYLFAGYLERVNIKYQAYSVLSITALAVLLLQMPPEASPSEFSYIKLFSLLTLRIFPAILITTSLSILMHGWVRAQGGAIPYHLYSVSNIGSLIALGCYPMFLQPSFGAALLSEIWTILFWALALLIAATALGLLILKKNNPHPESESELQEPEVISPKVKASWILLPAISTSLMLIVTQELTHELGSHPISWVPPFFLFLLVYTIVFTGRLAASLIIWWWALGLIAFSVFYIQPAALMDFLPHKMWALLVAQGFFTLAMTHMLYQLRPLKSYGLFYPYTALGGVIGGILCAIVFPLIFSSEIEIHLMTILLLGLFGYSLAQKTPPLITTILMAILAVLFGMPLLKDVLPKETELNLRSVYGAFKIQAFDEQIQLLHGSVLHGSQFVSPEKSRTPTTYYTESSSIGKLIRTLQDERERIHIGVVGLGTGTLATYLRPQDKITFWEIDPLCEFVARQAFTFIEETPGEVEIIIRDGRLGVSEFPQELDLVVVDAFSGDGVPMHLLTKEALETYSSRARDGLVALHVTNRHLKIGRVAQSTVEALGYDTLAIVSGPTLETKLEVNAKGSIYLLYKQSSNTPLFENLKQQLIDDSRQEEFFVDEAPDSTLFWTDDHHAVWPIVNWRGLLK